MQGVAWAHKQGGLALVRPLLATLVAQAAYLTYAPAMMISEPCFFT